MKIQVLYSKAFSLIELLVSLIIISLLFSAFSPLITKKLKASDITVGSFGKVSSDGVSIQRNVTKEDCKKLNAIYVPKGVNVPKPLCVMKYNIGDIGIEDWSGVKKCEAGKECTVENGKNEEVTKENLQAVCWVATSDKNTADAGCNDNFGGYDGCKRTVCNWTGANQMCSNIDWRLPTFDELTTITNDTYSSKDAYESENGSLMFCDHSASSISPMCPVLEDGCSGTRDNDCNPHAVWSSSFSSSSEAGERYLNGGWYDPARHLGHGFSARCVIDTISDKTIEEMIFSEPQGQDDCNKIAQNLLFVDKKYNGTGGKNLCVTKFNVGDKNVPIADSVTVVDAGKTCSDSDYHNCCWQGKTTDGCDKTTNDDDTYSGCTRTNCQWKAGNDSCLNWEISGQKGYFRLPSIEEMKGWSSHLDALTFNKGSKGLQLCDREVTSYSIRCGNGTYCNGAQSNGSCFPKEIWAKEAKSEGVYHQVQLANNTLEYSSYYSGKYAHSVRCVFDGEKHN